MNEKQTNLIDIFPNEYSNINDGIYSVINIKYMSAHFIYY